MIVAGSLAACVTNHAALEKRPIVASGGGGAGGSSGARAQVGGAPGNGGSGGGHLDDEPPGKNALTLVNGVVDAPELVLCLTRVDSRGAVVPIDAPLGEGALAYGQSLVVSDLSDSKLANQTLELFAIAGDLSLIAGLDCEAAMALAQMEEFGVADSSGSAGQAGSAGEGGAGAGVRIAANVLSDGGVGGAAGAGGEGGATPEPRSRLRLRALPAIPSGTLNQGRSLVFVLNGCMGGSGYSGPSPEAYCGLGYDEHQPTIAALLVSLSRPYAGDHVGMQVVNASLANGRIQVASRPPSSSLSQGSDLSITGNVLEGQVAPRPANVSSSASDYGIQHRYVLEVSSSDNAPFRESWSDVLAQSGFKGLTDGTTYALVFSGPESDLEGVPGLWNAPLLTLIAADPESPAAQ